MGSLCQLWGLGGLSHRGPKPKAPESKSSLRPWPASGSLATAPSQDAFPGAIPGFSGQEAPVRYGGTQGGARPWGLSIPCHGYGSLPLLLSPDSPPSLCTCLTSPGHRVIVISSTPTLQGVPPFPLWAPTRVRVAERLPEGLSSHFMYSPGIWFRNCRDV